MPTKTRNVPVHVAGGIFRSGISGGGGQIGATSYPQSELITYGVSPGYPKILVTNLLYSVKTRVQVQQSSVTGMVINLGWYSGSIWCVPPEPLTRNPGTESNSGMGAKAFNNASPLKKQADAAQILGELKDLPRMVKSTMELGRNLMSVLPKRKLSYSNPGDQYLNLQYGWIPFVSSVKELVNAQESIDKRVKQVLRDNGKLVRRSTSVRNTTTGGATIITDGAPYLRPYGISPMGKTTASSHITDSVWATFGFRYWLPQPNPVYGDRTISDRLRRELLGGDVNISLVWELTPWSWLIDWFVDIGSVLDNMVQNQRYNLVAQYGSLQHRTDYVNVRSCTAPIEVDHKQTSIWTTANRKPSSIAATSSSVITVKQRTPTGPYGSGLDFSGLNPYQLSILAALGLSRAK